MRSPSGFDRRPRPRGNRPRPGERWSAPRMCLSYDRIAILGGRTSAMVSALRRMLGWLGTHEPVVLLGLAIVVASTWLFADLADEVLEGDTKRFDEAVLLSLRTADDPATPIG